MVSQFIHTDLTSSFIFFFFLSSCLLTFSTSMANTGGGAHILGFPYPAQGHMIPLLDLTHQLAIRGLTITIVITPKNLPILNPLLTLHPSSVHPLVLPFPNHPAIPLGVENMSDLPSGCFSAMMSAMSELSDPILQWFQSHPNPPIAILSDFFLGWTHHLATQIGIPRIVFSPSGAFALALINDLWTELPTTPSDPSNDPNLLISFPKIPNSPVYPWWQLSTVYRSYVKGGPYSEFIKDGMVANTMSWGVVFNSFTELESEYLDCLKKNRCYGEDRVWAVGPLLPPPSGYKDRGGASSVISQSDLSWLDTCADHSVVYVCFGSQMVLANKQMDALATGLELSGVRFVWCVKEATKGHAAGEYGMVPSGFEDRTAGRGLVIRGWAPQVLILNHRAVGSFLTHCGWNSVLEGIVAGLTLLTWPMGADQFPNANLLVDQKGVGVRVCEGAMTVPNANELAWKLKESVCSVSKRERASELGEAARSAIKEGGSSFGDLDGMVQRLGGLNK